MSFLALIPFFVLMSLLFPSLARGAVGLDSQLSDLQEEWDAVGLTAWSVNGNASVCALGQTGERIKDSGEDLILTADARHHIGSVTKSMTATLLAILIEEGIVHSFNSTVAELLPYANGTAYADVTLRQLLGMLAGFPANAPNWFSYQQEAPNDLKAQRRMAAEDALATSPEHTSGTAYLYSNWGYVVAGHIIEEKTGMLWEEVLVDRLFSPLGVELSADPPSSMTGAPDTSSDPWGHFGAGLLPCNPETSEISCDNAPVMGPAGTFSGPVVAMAEYFAFHLSCHNGGHTLLSEESCQTLHQPADPSIDPYGFGWVCLERGWAGGEKNLTCTHNGSNTFNLYVVWLGFGIDRAFVAYTNSFRENDFLMTDSAIAAMINTASDGQCDASFPKEGGLGVGSDNNVGVDNGNGNTDKDIGVDNGNENVGTSAAGPSVNPVSVGELFTLLMVIPMLCLWKNS